ncbi:hypothetical protein JST97_15405 [bacterium]|nr:hypothetical protein [bacterium]
MSLNVTPTAQGSGPQEARSRQAEESRKRAEERLKAEFKKKDEQQKKLQDQLHLSQEAQEHGQECDLGALLGKIAEMDKDLQGLEARTAPAARPASRSSQPASAKGPTTINKDAPIGFLWKPVSDSDGKLAILLPPQFNGKVSGVTVTSPDGQSATGRSSGVGNGDRQHFRFNRPGSAFAPGTVVSIALRDGRSQQIPIQNPSMRNEGGQKAA